MVEARDLVNADGSVFAAKKPADGENSQVSLLSRGQNSKEDVSDPYAKVLFAPAGTRLERKEIGRTATIQDSLCPKWDPAIEGNGKMGESTSQKNAKGVGFYSSLFGTVATRRYDAAPQYQQPWVVEGSAGMKRTFAGAWRYPVLQEIRVHPITKLQSLVPWEESGGMLSVEIWDQDSFLSADDFLGHVSVSLRPLVKPLDSSSPNYLQGYIGFEGWVPLQFASGSYGERNKRHMDKLLLGVLRDRATMESPEAQQDIEKRLLLKEPERSASLEQLVNETKPFGEVYVKVRV